MIDIDIRCIDALELVRSIPCASVGMVHADPPWEYDNGTIRGGAWLQYDCVPLSVIREHLEATYDLVGEDAYLMVWCTFPLLMEWADESNRIANWKYVTGGCWGKTNGLGVGIHFRGDAELLLLYKKGSPRPLTTQSNLLLDRRIGHSEKPASALEALVRMATKPGELVLDLYAGESASLARVCRRLGRRYVGAEISPQRHARALYRLSLLEQSGMGLDLELREGVSNECA